MDQPPLDHHYIVQHLGGAKSVRRRNDGAQVATVAQLGSITVVPAGTRYIWQTSGPIEFAHLYLPPALLERTAARAGYSRSLVLKDSVGTVDPLLQLLYSSMLEEVSDSTGGDPLYLDSLLDALLRVLIRRHTTARIAEQRGREVLTQVACRRIAEYVQVHLGHPMSLAELQALTGSSRYHFARAFRNSMGLPPHQYVLHRRIEYAKSLLAGSDLSFAAIAIRCGFRDRPHFSKMFRRLVGQTCSDYRRALLPGAFRQIF